MSKLYSDPDHEVKGSKHLYEVVGTLESVAHWMRESVTDYDMRDLKRLFSDTLKDYKRYLDEKTNI